MSSQSTFDPKHIDRPDRSLLTYFLIVSLMAGPAFPLAFIPMWIRFATLRYKFDEEGISMCWGVLFRREIYLTYKRIQDIHLNRNIVQRWMNLATLSVQTASGKSDAEMSIEGILEVEQLRDYLYSRMRGAKDVGHSTGPTEHVADNITNQHRATQALVEIRDALQQLVQQKQQRNA